MKIISIFNEKGGIGKTTFALNLATYLSLNKNKKVLFIDNDSQCNSSMILADGELDNLLNENNTETIESLFLSQIKINKLILKSKFKNIDFISSSRRHSKTDWHYPYNSKRIIIKREYLEDVYDYVIVDNPATLFKNVLEVLKESDCVISPVEPCIFGLDGLFELLNTIAELNTETLYNNKIKLLSFLTKVDNRKAIKVNELRNELKELLNESFIENNQLSLYSAYQNTTCDFETIITSKKNSNVKKEVINLCDEILRRI